ncbi:MULTISPECIES: hypothetical protein [Lactococcus]|uniref:Uncharacterized protein n=2 Tax=Lactococcus TaxID=1357 RepID=A0AAJ2IXL8_9LACT|nr:MULTISPECIES: hypothetical protein [Lactococcus]MDT2528047.1 hypothetical protein [Lactococcus petauri]MDT2561283.1 hypothetical protein [Lactococcus petauri]MDT2586664.1 hypothetical protein [Lactococcus petauri]MDT2667599.1 hypothetical protein [Lactococcus petauri]SFL57141.1 hypothetical protein SAMN05216438_1207 [Lactococcus garvieae]
MPKINLKIAIPLVLITGTVIGGAFYFTQDKSNNASPKTYITKPQTSSTSSLITSDSQVEQSSQTEETKTAQPQNEALVESFVQTYFTQELTEEAIQGRLNKLKAITTDDFQNEMNIESSSKVALAMLKSYKETNVSPSGTANVNTQEIVKSQIFKSEQSDQEYFIQVEYTVTPLGSEDKSTIKNQVTVDLEDGKISSMSILNNQ